MIQIKDILNKIEKFHTQRGFQTFIFFNKYWNNPEAIALACNFIKKETLAQVISSEFCEISKNTFPHRTPPMAASDNLHEGDIFFLTLFAID